MYTAAEQAAIDAFKAEQDEEAASLQTLIDQGVWSLEGSMGRAMMRAIEDGRCILGPAPAHDYWGNRIPAEYEVQDGTKGSLQYAADDEITREGKALADGGLM